MCCVISAALKFVVLIVNLVLGLAFVAIAIVGVLLKTSSGFIQSIVNKILGAVNHKLTPEQVKYIGDFTIENSTALSIICIVVGGALAVLCFIGFFAACCGCACLLKIYAILLVILLVAQIIFVAVIFSDKEKYGNYVVLAMKELLTEYNPNTENGKAAAVLWDLTMTMNGVCCGLKGVDDFSNTKFKPNAPVVCCGNTNATVCTIEKAQLVSPPVEGCEAKILNFAVQNMEYVMYVFIAAILLQGVLLALVVGAIYANKVSPV